MRPARLSLLCRISPISWRFQIEHEGLTLQGNLACKGGFPDLAGSQQGNGRKSIQLLQHGPLQPPGHQARTNHATLQIWNDSPVLQG
jgi:hypothetical protein